MTECQRLFLVQARTDFAVFELLLNQVKQADLPPCHALHYLQMATELLGKAHAWKHDRPRSTHRAFVAFLRSLARDRKAQRHLGFANRNESWEHLIRKCARLAEIIQDLAPALALDGPNPEYPWPRAAPEFAPAEHEFEVWLELQEDAQGRQFLKLTRHLFAAADTYL